MDDTEQMIVNELRRIDRAIERREKALQAIDKKEGMRTFPRRYVIDLPVDIPATPLRFVTEADLTPTTRSFVIDRDCKRFFCHQMTASLIVRGDSNAIPASLTPPTGTDLSTSLFFLWKVRDTSTDRDWSDYPLPSYVMPVVSLIGNHLLPAPAVLDPGTEVEVSLKPITAILDIAGSNVQNIRQISVVFSFIGFEVL
jgi:hypothetical protein